MRIPATRGHRLDPVAHPAKGASAPPAKGAPPPLRGAPPLPPDRQGGAASSAPPAQVKLEPGAPGPGRVIDVISLIESDDDDAAPAPATTTTTDDGDGFW